VSRDGKANHDPLDEPRLRRESGARRQHSVPVVFVRDGDELHGWALNQSPGGLRAVLDADVSVGDRFLLLVGDSSERRQARVVWVKPDSGGGAIVGLAFDGADSAPPPPPTSVPPPAGLGAADGTSSNPPAGPCGVKGDEPC
jgi:hypothetical protein